MLTSDCNTAFGDNGAHYDAFGHCAAYNAACAFGLLLQMVIAKEYVYAGGAWYVHVGGWELCTASGPVGLSAGTGWRRF